jgi:lysophospholipase L1-like esterase
VQIQAGRWSVVLLVPFFVSFCGSSPRGVIILCAGDSLTAEAYPHFLQQILNREGPRARVVNYGRSGHTSGEYLSYLVRNRETLAAERPDFILFQLGTNDVRTDVDHTTTAAFIGNMKRIVAVFREFRSRSGKAPTVFLAMIPPIPEGTPLPFTAESSRRVTEDINPAIREISDEDKLILVDNYRLFVEAPGLLPGVHPSPEGYRRLAENWFSTLKSLSPRK